MFAFALLLYPACVGGLGLTSVIVFMCVGRKTAENLFDSAFNILYILYLYRAKSVSCGSNTIAFLLACMAACVQVKNIFDKKKPC